jgi:hypothetical protein
MTRKIILALIEKHFYLNRRLKHFFSKIYFQNHEIQILRMTYNYVRILGKNVYKSAGLLNLQRIFMNHCHVQVIDLYLFLDLTVF